MKLKSLQIDALRLLRSRGAVDDATALTPTQLGMGLMNCNFWNRLHGALLIGRVTDQGEWRVWLKPAGGEALAEAEAEAEAGADQDAA